jgi:hypothetical protein
MNKMNLKHGITPFYVKKLVMLQALHERMMNYNMSLKLKGVKSSETSIINELQGSNASASQTNSGIPFSLGTVQF